MIIALLMSTASGEPPLCMAANALFAVKNAIQSALGEIGAGNSYFALSLQWDLKLMYVWLMVSIDAPATVDSIQTSCQVSIDQFSF